MATANSPQANAAEKITGPVRVVMPDQTGNFQLNAPRGAVQRVQVVDVDMVLHMADGTKVVLAGGAMEAMDDRSKIKFADTTQDTGRFLDQVGKIPLQPNDQSKILNSDPIATHDRTASAESNGQGQANVTYDRNAASVTSDAVSQLSKIIHDNATSVTSNGAQSQSIPTQPTAGESSSVAVQAAIVASQNSTSDTPPPTKQVEVTAPPERPGTIPSTHVIGPQAPTMAVKLVNLTTVTQDGSTLYGSGGIPASATDASNLIQFSTQQITAGNDVTTIYAAGNSSGSFVKVFNVAITGDGTVLSLTVTGIPSNMTVLNGTDLGNGTYQIAVSAGQKEFNLQLQYNTVLADSASPVHQQFDLTFTTSIATSDGVLSLTDLRHVAVKDATSYNDLTYLDPATGDSVLILPAQGVPHEVHAGNNAGTTIYGSNANDLLYGGTGNDTIYGGSGNTYFEGGAGADRLVGGSGNNTAGYTGSSSGVTVDLAAGTGTGGDAQGDTLTNIQNVKGSAYSDTIVANAAVNRIDGGSGGSDTVSYSASTAGVTVNLVTSTGSGGYAQGDTYTHIQNVIGSAYNDIFIANTDANRFDGGSGGSDTVSYASSGAGVNVNLQTGLGSGGAAAGDSYTHIQNIIGTAYDDTFVGNVDANSFDGGTGGNDTVSYAGSTAGVSVNFVNGRGTGGFADGDTYNHIQNVIGSAYDDTFVAGIDSVHFDGGSAGSDTVNYGASTAAVTVNMITLTGSGGYAQNNTYTHIQNIVGSSYSDTFIASLDANSFNGGLGGSDTVSYAFSTQAVTVDLYNGTGSGGYAQGDTLAHIQNVIGSNFDDIFIASADANNFNGGLGSNTVSYARSTGPVTIDLTNTIGTGTGGAYAAGDSFTNIQNLIGSVYDDTFIASSDANSFDGGGSSVHNRVSYAASTLGVTVDLNYTNGTGTGGGYATGDKLVNIQDLTGSNFNDTFVASAADNSFDGGLGSNTVSYAASTAAVTIDLVNGTGSGGYANNDTYVNIQNVIGSDGNDTFIASNAANAFEGGLGNNTVSYAKASDATGVTVDLVNGVGSNGFAAGDSYSHIQNVIGSAYDDTFIASAEKNVFTGLQGSDTVSYAYSNAGVTVDLVNNVGTGGYADTDVYVGIENAIGSSQDDLFISSSDSNTFDGGVSSNGSHNRVSYAYSGQAVTVDLNHTDGTGTSGGYAAGDKLINIQDVTGSAFDDTFYANALANKFDGGTGTLHNLVNYSYSVNGVKVDLFNNVGGDAVTGQVSYANGDTYVNIQDVTGS
ncbi:calcium-binding protein, partial [Herbaspirillum lusitanum]